jgi:two-component system response regulator FixJ
MPDRPHAVLIVDDDEAVRDALRFALRLEGFVVHAYSSGGELLAQKELPSATCVVIDEKMPGMDGFELLKLLRVRHITLPSILITSHLTARLRARAAAAGVRWVLEKPLLDNALTECVQAILRQRNQIPTG